MRSLDQFYKYIAKQEQALREQAPEGDAAEAGGDTPPDADTPPADAPLRSLEETERGPKQGAVVRGTASPAGAPASSGGGPPPSASPGRVRYVMRGGVTIPVPIDEELPPPVRPTPRPEPPARPAPRPERPSVSRTDSVLTEAEREALAVDMPGDEERTPEREPEPEPTVRSKPERPRSAQAPSASAPDLSDGEAAALWGRLPRHIQLLIGMTESQEEEVAQKYYRRGFKESRQQLVERLLDPPLTLEDTARILGVCPTTVRRYTNRGQLPHYRTVGQQRRFRLSDVLAFLEKQASRSGLRDLADDDGGAAD